MANEANLIRQPGLKAAADLSAAANQFRAVKMTAANSVNIAGAGEFAIGVLYNKPKSGVRAEVVVQGTPKLSYGGTVAVGDLLAADASGDFVKTTPAVGNLDNVLAVALEAGVTGEIGSGKWIGQAGGANEAVS